MQRSVVGHGYDEAGDDLYGHAQTSGFTYGHEHMGSRVYEKAPMPEKYQQIPLDNKNDSNIPLFSQQPTQEAYPVGAYAYAKVTEDPTRDIVGDGLKDTLHGSPSPVIRKSAVKTNAVTTDRFVRTPVIDEAFSMAIKSGFLDLEHIVQAARTSYVHHDTSDQTTKGVGFDVGKRLSGAGAAIGAAIGSVFHHTNSQPSEDTPDVKVARNREAFTGQHQSVDSYDPHQEPQSAINRASFGSKPPEPEIAPQYEEMPSTWPDSTDTQKSLSHETRGISSGAGPSIRSSMGLGRGANLVKVNKERIKQKHSNKGSVLNAPSATESHLQAPAMPENARKSPSVFVEDEISATVMDDWEDRYTDSESYQDSYQPTSHLMPLAEHDRHVATPDIPPIKMGHPVVDYGDRLHDNLTHLHKQDNFSECSDHPSIDSGRDQHKYQDKNKSSYSDFDHSGFHHQDVDSDMGYRDHIEREENVPTPMPRTAMDYDMRDQDLGKKARVKSATSDTMYLAENQHHQSRMADMAPGVHSNDNYMSANQQSWMSNKDRLSSNMMNTTGKHQRSYSKPEISPTTERSSAMDGRHVSEGNVSEAANYLTKLAASATAAIDSGIHATESAVKSLIKDTGTQESKDKESHMADKEDHSGDYHYGTKSGHQEAGAQELTTSFHNPNDVSTYGRTHNTLPKDNAFLPLTSKANSKTNDSNFPNADQLAPTESERRHYREQIDQNKSKSQTKAPIKETVRLVYSAETDSYVPASPEKATVPVVGSAYTGPSSIGNSRVDSSAPAKTHSRLSHPLSGFADPSKDSMATENKSRKDGTALGNDQSSSIYHHKNSSHLAKLAAGGAIGAGSAMAGAYAKDSSTFGHPSAPPESASQGYNQYSGATDLQNSRKLTGYQTMPKDAHGLSTAEVGDNFEPGVNEVIEVPDASGQESGIGMYRSYNDEILSEPTESGDSNITLPSSSRNMSPCEPESPMYSNQYDGIIVEDETGMDYGLNQSSQYEYKNYSDDNEADESSIYDADNDESNESGSGYSPYSQLREPRHAYRDKPVVEDKYIDRTPLNERVGNVAQDDYGYSNSSNPFRSSQTTSQAAENKRNMEYIAAGVAGAGFAATLKSTGKQKMSDNQEGMKASTNSWPQGFTAPKSGIREENISREVGASKPADPEITEDHYPQLPSSSVHHNVHNVKGMREKINRNPANNDDVRPYDPGNNESNEDISTNSFGASFRALFSRKSMDQNMSDENQRSQKRQSIGKSGSDDSLYKKDELIHSTKRPLDEMTRDELPPSYSAATHDRSNSYDSSLPSKMHRGSSMSSGNNLENMARKRNSVQETGSWGEDNKDVLKATNAQHNLDWKTVANFHGPVPERHDATAWSNASESLKEDNGVFDGCKKDSVYKNLFEEKMEDSNLAKDIKGNRADMASRENEASKLDQPAEPRRLSTFGATEATLSAVGASIGAAIRSALGKGPQEEKPEDIDAYGEHYEEKSKSNTCATQPMSSQDTDTASNQKQENEASELLKKREGGEFNLANKDGTPLEAYDPVTGLKHSSMNNKPINEASNAPQNRKTSMNSDSNECLITDRKEGLIANRKEDLITDRKEDLITDRKEGLIADRKEDLITDRDEGLITDRKEDLITDRKEGLITDRKEDLITDRKEDLITDRKEGLITDRKEDLITDRKEGLITDRKEDLITDRKEGLITDRKEDLITDRKEDLITDRKEDLITDRKEDLITDRNEGLITDRKEDLITDRKGKGPATNDNQDMNVDKDLPEVKGSKDNKIPGVALGTGIGATIGSGAATLTSRAKEIGNKATGSIKQSVKQTINEKKLPGISTSHEESQTSSKSTTDSLEQNQERSFQSSARNGAPTPPAKDAKSAYFEETSPEPSVPKNEEKSGIKKKMSIVAESLDLKAMREKHKRASLKKSVDSSAGQSKTASNIGKTLGAAVAGAGTEKTISTALNEGYNKSQAAATEQKADSTKCPTDVNTDRKKLKSSNSWRKATYYSGSKSPGACPGPGQGVWVYQTKNPLTCKKKSRSASTSSIPSGTKTTHNVGSYVGAGTGIWDDHVENPLTSKRQEQERKKSIRNARNRRSCQN
ncbi:hypothetical protein CLU79DRAFT_869506 [Phycomyces nitens]|nr:hypothetical protein CLU79DRAFT_869506 [Phycomyces nitens]